MSKTRAELIEEVAGLLNIAGPGESLSSEDQKTIDARIDPKISELSGRRVVYIADADAIEDEYFDALAALIAEACGPSFGLGRNRDARIEAETRLREIGSQSWGEGDVVKAEYF
jgi:hypothetical protein